MERRVEDGGKGQKGPLLVIRQGFDSNTVPATPILNPRLVARFPLE